MNLSKLGQALTAREIFDLIQDDLEQVEKKITLESVASVDAVTAIGQYLQSAGGKRLRPALLLLSAKLVGNGGPSAVLPPTCNGAITPAYWPATGCTCKPSRSRCASAASRCWTSWSPLPR